MNKLIIDMIKLLQIIKQSFCFHDYVIPPEYDDQENRDKMVASLKEGESISFSRIHRCTKCNKETVIGSGTYY